MKPRSLIGKFVFVLGCLAIGAADLAHAESKVATFEQQAAVSIEKALQKHGGDVHRCFERVLADRLDTAGKVQVMVEVGKAGKVQSAKVQGSGKNMPVALSSCVEKAALGWNMEGIEAGARVLLPFSFKAQSTQFVVQAADVPDRALGGAASATTKGKGGPKRAAPFTVKVLADETNVSAQGISLTLLSVGPASRVAMHRHPHSSKILYLVKGHARLLGPEGTSPIKLEEGAAAFIPAGFPHVIENMGRQSTAVFLQAFSPPGPERVYRDATDARGRAEFEVIRDPSLAKLPPESGGPLLVASGGETKSNPLPLGAGSGKDLFPAGGPLRGRMGLTVLELADGAELLGSDKGRGTQILYFLSGSGTLTLASEKFPFAPEAMVYLPQGVSYAIKVAAEEKGEKVAVVEFQLSAQAGTNR